MDFYHWLIEKNRLSEATASKYNLVIKNRILEWLPSYELPQNIIEFEALKALIMSLEIYQERNRVGNNMYSSALKHYGNYLKELSPIDDVIFFQDDDVLTVEAERLVKVRLLQNKFRKALFDLNRFCVVSGLANSQFLIASHIKPWSKSNDQEKIDPYNGFLLTPNFDHLFDKGYITILESGSIRVSKSLGQTEKNYFEIPSKLKIDLHPSYSKYLNYHNKEIFKW